MTGFAQLHINYPIKVRHLVNQFASLRRESSIFGTPDGPRCHGTLCRRKLCLPVACLRPFQGDADQPPGPGKPHRASRFAFWRPLRIARTDPASRPG